MSEEVKIKISQPMFEVGELERFDNNIHNIIKEYSKLMFKEKDQILTQRIIMKQEEEIERLNNIIKEVREYIMSELITEWDIKNGGHVSGSDLPVEVITPILKILDKENNNEDN